MTATAPSTDAPLAGRTVLITGAAAGLGAATAIAAGAAGAEIILLGRGVPKLEQVYDEILARGGPQPAIMPLDLEGATPDDYADLADRIEAQFGHLHALIHNAAISGPMTSIEHYPPLEWLRVMQVNLNAPLLLTQACLPLLRHEQSPRILFICDRRAEAYWGAYGVSKAGLSTLAAILDEETQGSTPITVETIYPGPMRTGMRVNTFPGEQTSENPPPDEEAVRIAERLKP